MKKFIVTTHFKCEINNTVIRSFNDLQEAKEYAIDWIVNNHFSCDIYEKVADVEQLIEESAKVTGKKCQCTHEAGDSPCDIHDLYYSLGLLEE